MGKLFEEPYGNHCHQLSVNKSNLFDRYKETLVAVKLMNTPTAAATPVATPTTITLKL
jgi:hypothetical protein